ncbi:hypothetical protein FOXG_04370 [Fusarium oxysporum f. sp. lycopersici 4287]|uniref:Uncharacterized protein n=2 Tax=Fusarium oxysporum TaxID=5507 RepID=A0A0J9UP12_FUSO4|nr:hypothetical protein FOXG_04370 [Fusarium oxysporum f. sp. lycopersici 4287]KAJ0154334.1 Succinate--CoA ligase [ADP-forming] subunit alpha [Fusarium oxysporum f. sp. albedinis]KNB01025.1 hypothetical protein FOXG_04370 [Fusarium oxysporum f. sp. lycopersici 4287]
MDPNYRRWCKVVGLGNVLPFRKRTPISTNGSWGTTVAALYSRSYTEQNVKARKMQDHDLEIEFLLIHCGAFPTCPVPGLRNPHSQSAVCIALKYWNYDSEF